MKIRAICGRIKKSSAWQIRYIREIRVQLPPFGQWIRRTRFVQFVQFVFKKTPSAWQIRYIREIRVQKYTHPHGKSVFIREIRGRIK